MQDIKEYWVNVYLNPYSKQPHRGACHSDKLQCIQHAKWDDWKAIYRIHVKMKSHKQIVDDAGKRLLKILPEIYN